MRKDSKTVKNGSDSFGQSESLFQSSYLQIHMYRVRHNLEFHHDSSFIRPHRTTARVNFLLFRQRDELKQNRCPISLTWHPIKHYKIFLNCFNF